MLNLKKKRDLLGGKGFFVCLPDLGEHVVFVGEEGMGGFIWDQ